MQRRHVDATVAQHPRLCPEPGRQDLDTDGAGFDGRTPAEGAATPVRLATLPDGGPSGRFSDDEGEVPW